MNNSVAYIERILNYRWYDEYLIADDAMRDNDIIVATGIVAIFANVLRLVIIGMDDEEDEIELETYIAQGLLSEDDYLFMAELYDYTNDINQCAAICANLAGKAIKAAAEKKGYI